MRKVLSMRIAYGGGVGEAVLSLLEVERAEGEASELDEVPSTKNKNSFDAGPVVSTGADTAAA
jgi:hypothetical protein